VDIALGVTIFFSCVSGSTARATSDLSVLRALTESIVLAQQQGGMMEKVLEELQRLTKAKGRVFRLIEGGHLVATHAVGSLAGFPARGGECQT